MDAGAWVRRCAGDDDHHGHRSRKRPEEARDCPLAAACALEREGRRRTHAASVGALSARVIAARVEASLHPGRRRSSTCLPMTPRQAARTVVVMTNTASNNATLQATSIETAVARNRAFAAAGGHEGAVVFPALRLFVITCLDRASIPRTSSASKSATRSSSATAAGESLPR